jgi:hypothetical protein
MRGRAAGWVLVWTGCTSSAGKLPVADLFAATDTAAARDTAAPDDSGDSGDSGIDSGLDTGEDTGEVIVPAVGPWPAESDDLGPGGDMDCTNLLTPCNHVVRLAVGDGSGTWTLVPTPVASRASVPDAMIVDHGELEGQRWRSLWLTFVDVYPDHIPAEADAENILSVAILPFPDSLADTPSELLETLDTGGPVGWIRKRTDTWKLGYRIVDPDREMFADTPEVAELTDVQHAMLVIDLDLSSEPGTAENKLYLLESTDGFSFDFTAEVEMGRVGTDPDCYPLQTPIADYPAVVPTDWAPGGPGEWGCNVSGYQEFSRYEGSLFEQVGTGVRASGVTVTSTTATDGQRTVWGHVDAAESANPGQADLVRTLEDSDGTYTTAELVLDSDDLPGAERGIHAPTVLHVAEGVELLVFHSYIDDP